MLLDEGEKGISAPIAFHALSLRTTSVSRDTKQPKKHIAKIR
ncbi:protein of unknown function (plasmid) [Vibrio tapetis subsp. tapetis]|uniref:Uncharacterized protein n=1 Tax=Vibrio tapetis subsp. tapetis TaxID=1671868 RepID=A0A2N8ZNH8_9VIBR|nr:protein of unknown function [Vibrio tapetis subsp. tapetis]